MRRGTLYQLTRMPSLRRFKTVIINQVNTKIIIAASVPLKAGGSWCVDNTGASRMGKAEGGGNEPARCGY